MIEMIHSQLLHFHQQCPRLEGFANGGLIGEQELNVQRLLAGERSPLRGGTGIDGIDQFLEVLYEVGEAQTCGPRGKHDVV